MFGLSKNYTILKRIDRLNEDIDRLFVAQNIIKLISSKNSFEEIAKEILNQIEQKMNYTGASISIVDLKKDIIELKYLSDSFVSTISRKLNILDKDSFIPMKLSAEPITLTKKAVLENKIIIDKDLYKFTAPPMSIAKAKLIQSISMTKCMVALPIRAQEKVIAVLNFTLKKEVKEISENELKTLELFIDQIGLILDNISKYQEIKSFNNKLEEEIQKATEALRIKYNDLSSLYNLTSEVSQSLDPNLVAQTAVNSLPQDKMMVGAVLNFYDINTRKLKFWAASHNALSEAIEKVIGNFDKIESDLSTPESDQEFLKEVVLTSKPKLSNDVASFFSPPIPKQFIPIIQKILNIKSVASFPLVSRGLIFGTVTYLLKEKQIEELDDNEKQLLETYTNQISISLQNASLYSTSQTIQKNMEQALQQVQNARKHEQDMIDILGHELRTPATICRGNIELLLSMVKVSQTDEQWKEKILSKLNSAYTSIMQEAGLISELLTATKLDSGQLVITNEEVDLYTLVKNIFANYIETAKKNNLNLYFDEPKQPIAKTIGDNVRISEVVDNLISNALKYTKIGTVIVTLGSDENFVYFHIKDTGNGIPKSEIPTLFQKFRRLNNYISTSKDTLVRPGGTGLGLYVAKGIIEAHGGKIWVESDGEGQGSTFSFSLPIRKINGNTNGNDMNTLDMFHKLGLKK